MEERYEVRERRKFRIPTKVKLIGICTVLVVTFLSGMLVNEKWHNWKEDQKISTGYVSGKLEDVGELTTQKLTYTGVVTLSKGDIPFINKSGFTMKYNATANAGMEIEEFDIKVKKDKVVVTIPHATFQDVVVDPDSIEFYDEKFSLFNRYGKEGTAEAVSEAKKDVAKNADCDELLIRADENAEELIHRILDDSVGRREVEVRFR